MVVESRVTHPAEATGIVGVRTQGSHAIQKKRIPMKTVVRWKGVKRRSDHRSFVLISFATVETLNCVQFHAKRDTLVSSLSFSSYLEKHLANRCTKQIEIKRRCSRPRFKAVGAWRRDAECHSQGGSPTRPLSELPRWRLAENQMLNATFIFFFFFCKSENPPPISFS